MRASWSGASKLAMATWASVRVWPLVNTPTISPDESMFTRTSEPES